MLCESEIQTILLVVLILRSVNFNFAQRRCNNHLIIESRKASKYKLWSTFEFHKHHTFEQRGTAGARYKRFPTIVHGHEGVHGEEARDGAFGRHEERPNICACDGEVSCMSRGRLQDSLQ